ncbi:hypothetical protein QR680_005003 [Steinernema hermaphroditum]|uniref:RING-type domain-containing protein n=1 Tax=Steinernema hermaphroditum TaxID=289476 RepID=A0AA39HQI2_9BILA|nr:hypothetical protein QR680_005003 [Steinernema hermaphroditum]
MKDCCSFTGVSNLGQVFAVNHYGNYLLFAKAKQRFYYFHTDRLEEHCELELAGLSGIHENDAIFDVTFVDEINLLVVLRHELGDRLFFSRAHVDLKAKAVKIDDPLVDTKITVRSKGFKTCLIEDECGPVLLSFPIRIQEKSVIELVHVGSYFEYDEVPPLISIPIKNLKVNNAETIWCDPFISRNHLYFFSHFDNLMLTVKLDAAKGAAASDADLARVVRTKPNALGEPRYNQQHKQFLVFDDHLLVYLYRTSYQRPQMWKLKLGSLEWSQMPLSLSHHYPTSYVRFRRHLDSLYLHGDCERIGCSERSHLYKFDPSEEHSSTVEHKSSLATPKGSSSNLKKSGSLSSLFHLSIFSSSLSAAPEEPKPKSYVQSASKSSTPTRYMKYRKTRPSSVASTSTLSSLASSASLPSFKSYAATNWSRQMAFQGVEQHEVSEQIKKALDMGFKEEHIMAAFDANSGRSTEYQPFPSTNAMVDMLDRVQRMESGKDEKMRSSASFHNINHHGYSFNGKPSSSLVTRATSFNGDTPRRPLSMTAISIPTASVAPSNHVGNNAFQRMLSAFEREKKNIIDESKRSIEQIEMMLRESQDHSRLNADLVKEHDREICQLKAKLHDAQDKVKENESLQERIHHLYDKSDQKTEELRAKEQQMEALRADFQKQLQEKAIQCQELEGQLRQMEDNAKRFEEVRKRSDEYKEQSDALRRELERCNDIRNQLNEADSRVEEMKRERDEMRQRINNIPTCVICMEKAPKVVFMPCLHFVTCEACGNGANSHQLDKCPTCRNKVLGRMVVFM